MSASDIYSSDLVLSSSSSSSSSSSMGGESAHARDASKLVEKISRLKIFNCSYWKQHCFGLTAETLLDRAVELKFYGGMYGGSGRPSPFICLVLKMLQLRPDSDVVSEYVFNEDFKYLRLLGAFYIRLTSKAETVYRMLEPLYNDFRKVAFRSSAGWQVKHIDEFIDELLHEELVCDIALPYLLPRAILEHRGVLGVRVSSLPPEECTKEVLDRAAEREADAAQPVPDASIAAEEHSTEHWNNIREKLGMNKLRD